MSHDDEFYIGYEPEMPPGLARRVRFAVALGAGAVVVLALVATAVQRPLATSSFDFGRQLSWTGRLVRIPAPALLVPTPAGYRWFWLVGRGKHGAEPAIAPVPDGWATVTGTLISRERWRMIEVVSATAATAPERAQADPPAIDGAGEEVTLRGEIVDSKCFLGVMNPGEHVVHRDCAIRCLSGGVPPMLAYATADGRRDLAVLVDADGRLLHDELHHAAGHQVSARGRLFTINGQPVFQLTSLAGQADDD
jgi:hypothetical protein